MEEDDLFVPMDLFFLYCILGLIFLVMIAIVFIRSLFQGSLNTRDFNLSSIFPLFLCMGAASGSNWSRIALIFIFIAVGLAFTILPFYDNGSWQINLDALEIRIFIYGLMSLAVGTYILVRGRQKVNKSNLKKSSKLNLNH